MGAYPKGPRAPKNGALGPKYHECYSMWALKPDYLDPWTQIHEAGGGFRDSAVGICSINKQSVLYHLRVTCCVGFQSL